MNLPDLNVLIALVDPAHDHHEPAKAWFVRAREHGWATCLLTENGFVRVLANPSYPNVRLSVREVAEQLRTLRAENGDSHQFWPDDVSLYDETLFDLAAVQGYRQMTDLYLLGLCHRHKGTLVTFDTGIRDLTRGVVAARADLLRLLDG